MNFMELQIMDKILQFTLLGLFVGLTAIQAGQQEDVISFTHPLYHGTVQEKAVSSVVDCDVMMGMWLTELTRDVRFDVVGDDRRFQANKRISGNFVILELRTQSVSRSQDVRIRAISPDFNQETFCTVRVNVIDINDFQPLFPPDPYFVSINEDTKVGAVITYVKATDSDRALGNTQFYYSIFDYTSDYFAVHPTTGAVFLTAPLNAKSQASHSIEIQATDRKAALAGTAKPKRTTVTVSVTTVNSHSPKIVVHKPLSFDSKVNIDVERKQQTYAILRVSDDDLDLCGQTTAPIVTHCDIPGLLSVEPTQQHENEYRLVFTRTPPHINGIINTTIEVSDRCTPPRQSREKIAIKLFDRRSLAPAFLKDAFAFVVSEISPVHTQVGFVNAEVLNSEQSFDIRYSILNGNENGYFRINEKTSLITTAKRLDRSLNKNYSLTVSATNINSIDYEERNTSILANIVIEDANNHDPVFDSPRYSATISENAPVGSILTRVHASDEDYGSNGTVIYTLVDSSGLPFTIDPFNGTIYTTGLLDSDVFSSNTFELRVRAADSGLPFNRKSECLVNVHIVNKNDNPPVFNEVDCAVTVPVSTPMNVQILQLELIDIDRNPVTCMLLSGGDGWFEVTARTCELRLTADLTNTESSRHYSLLITASDGKHTTEAMVVNVTISYDASQIEKVCRDTGAIRHFEDSMNNPQLSNSHSGARSSESSINSTSQIRNKYKPKVVPHSSHRIVQVSEDTPLGSVITRIQATDRDTGYNGKLWYTITSGNDESCFIINTQTGDIRLARSLDREHRSKYNMTVTITDLGIPSRATHLRINFIVTDVNDNAPVFSRSQYVFEIPENVSVGYQIQSKIDAIDIDEDENAQVRYSFLSHSYGSNVFSIDPYTGFINVTKSLDREITPVYNLTVVATDAASDPRSSSTTVIIRLLDVNDNAPKFYQSQYQIQIAEDLPLHAVIFWLEAHDPDEGENGAVRYTLTDGISNRNGALARFHVDDRTGAIRLSAKLDARVQNRYNITARARDSKKLYSTCYIEVEVVPVNRNLNAPYFGYRDTRLEVSENAVIGTNIGSLSAVDEDKTDPERDIGYYIVDGTGLGIFDIDQNTGAITTLRTFDRETEKFYWITVVARDRADVPLSGHVFVLIEITDINDNAPQPNKPMYSASVLENSPVGTVITKIEATDRDSGPGGNITYSMPQNKYFMINPLTGAITTTVKKRLDREGIDVSQLSFDVTISDSGSPPLSSLVRVFVNITDQNDNDPVFYQSIKKKIFLVARNRTRQAQPIARVVAFDDDAGDNADIDYLLDHSQKFTINPKSGIISTSKAFKAGQTSTFKISAFDLGKNQRSSKLRLQIEWQSPPLWSRSAPVFDSDVEDLQNAVYFEHVDVGFVVDESRVQRTIGVLQATDVDSETIWFRIAAGNEDNMFDIDGDNALYVAGEPDAESKDFYNLTIEASDGYNSAYKQVAILIGDINDHHPEFSEKVFRATISENSPPNKRVVQLPVSDGDRTQRNRNFIFKIRGSVDPASAAKFRITSDGTIYTTAQLDRETQLDHTLFIEVDDQGVPGPLQAYCQVIITVLDKNEHPPQFTSAEYFGQAFVSNSDYRIGPNETSEKVVVRVRATDRDFGENARVFYSIESGDKNGFWKINPSTGEIKAAKQLHLENGNPEKVTSFIVKATDGGRPALTSTTTVIIKIRRRNNAIPQFASDEVTVEISESAAIGSFVTLVTATASSGTTYSFQSGNTGEQFSINPHSGVVSLASRLDRERKSNYRLVVACISTEGMKATSPVIVHVTDVNDNRPRFLSPSYVGYVTESSNFVGSTPVTDEKNRPLLVDAVDADYGNNARIAFAIIDAKTDIDQRFTIDSDTGIVMTKAGIDLFDYEATNKYQFWVQCFDLGSPRLFSERRALVTIHVRDVNDTVPTFTKAHYVINLLLPTAEGVIVSKETRAANPSQFHKANRLLSYSISGGNDNSAFKIDQYTGTIYVSNPSNLIDNDEFNFRLRVTDGKRSSAAKATVTISSLDERNALVFTQDRYDANVKENSTEKKGLVATHVVGVELDDNLRFRILNPNPSLEIGFTSGVVSTTGVPMDREIQSVHDLLVEVADVNTKNGDGSLPSRGRCKIRISVTDINDNPPQFLKPVYYATVQVEAEPGTIVKQVVNLVVVLFQPLPEDGVMMRHPRPHHGTPAVSWGSQESDDHFDPAPTPRQWRSSMTSTHYSVLVSYDTLSARLHYSNPVKATDDDLGKNSVVNFSLKGKHSSMFDVDARTGIVTLRRTPNVNVDGGNVKFNITVVARDMGSPSLTGEVSMLVSIVNRATPVFTQQFYDGIKVSEDAQPYTVVSDTVKASSPDGSDIYFTIEDGDRMQLFDIDFLTGTITTRGTLDHEQQSLYRLRIRARDAQSRAFADVEVEVEVTDVNDHAPIFHQSHYSASLPETANVGTTVIQVEATDEDSGRNGQLAYEMVDGDHSDGGYFHIDQDTGVIWTARDLFVEGKAMLSFVVRASDYGAPLRHTDVMVTLQVEDVNNNPPSFDKSAYEFDVSAQAKAGQFVGKVSASDMDSSDGSRLTYSIPNGEVIHQLEINSNTGVVSLARDIDAPISTNITVTDGVFLSTVGFIIRLASEDTSPSPVVFRKPARVFTITENQPAGTNVGKVSASGIGPLNYRIETETVYSDMFRIDSRSGRIQTAQVLDREAIGQHQDDAEEAELEFIVTATDKKGFVAKRKVRIRILDENDNDPVFSQSEYFAVLDPRSEIKDSVVNLTAFDLDKGVNGRVTYSWHEASSKVKQVFSLDYDEGQIKIRERPPFGDIEILSFFVRASDHGPDPARTDIVSVSVYLPTDTESIPKFPEETISTTIVENVAVGTEVATVQAAVSNGLPIVYALPDNYVEENGDSNPADEDFSKVQRFSIDATSGRITTVSVLDRETEPNHVITVLAYVKTTPELVTSTQVLVAVLDVNDNAPLFTSSEYRASMLENLPEKTAVAVVKAFDLDDGWFGEVTYSLKAAEDGSELPFIIDEKTGLVSTGSTLDREVASHYDLVVQASDGGVETGPNQRRLTVCHVSIDVIDVNDSPPVFLKSFYQATIPESAAVGFHLPNLVRARDSDERGAAMMRFYITGGDLEGHFEMVWDETIRDGNTAFAGIKVVKKLDREERSSYLLTVLVTDGLHSNTSRLRIEVADVNDNAPVCEQFSYYGSVSENLSARNPILRIHSSDADAGENGRITYELSGERSNAFILNSNSGELLTAKPLDHEMTSQYRLTATATDGGGKSCQCKIYITVLDENDNPPQLVDASLVAATRENTPKNSLIHRVNARDVDSGTNGSFVFSLIDDVNGQFYIEPSTGVVILMKPLDRETVPSYELRVKVRDRGNVNRMSSTGLLILNVLDINDNPPIFEHEQYESEIPENQSVGHSVARISAKSLDTGTNAKLRYVISGGNEHGKFNINEDTGEVRLQSKLDYETDQSYVLKISASDLSENPLSSECSLRVNVTDINDNPPEFTSPYKVTLPEDIELDHVVVTLSAVDRDSGDAGNVTYQLSLSNDADIPFVIDALSGKLLVSSPGLDYERQRLYRVAVTAIDSGLPPLQTDTIVEVSLYDVNDNRPLFNVAAPPGGENSPNCSPDGANCTVFVHESASDAVTRGIVLLNATDADGIENGGPFQFKIKGGSSKGLFRLDKDNVVRATKPLELDNRDSVVGRAQELVHLLVIEARDSGIPVPLTSRPDLVLRVIVLKENQYPPEMTPHYVQIATPHNEYQGEAITQSLHATDQDAFDQDRLRFSLASPDDFERFVIDPLTGAITSLSPLPTGVHNFTVRVSDGSRYSVSAVSVNVNRIGEQALENSVSISFSEMNDIDEYLTKYHSLFVTKLSSILPLGFKLSQDLVIMSLQMDEENDVQLLFGIRNPSKTKRNFYSSKSLKRFLEKSRQLLNEAGIRVKWIEGTNCPADQCPYGSCRQIPHLEPASYSTFSTNSYSLITTSFTKQQTCVCPLGTTGEFCESICSKDNNPCSKNRVCVVDEMENRGYRCDPTEPTNTVMAFNGRSYARYALDSSTESSSLRISMRLRTFQSNSTIFYAFGLRHFARLQTSEGLLQFTFDCGSGPQTMKQDQKVISDGRWSQVDIESRQDVESNSCAFKMTIDGTYIATTEAPVGDPRFEVSNIVFGGMPLKNRAKRNAEPGQEKRDAAQNRVIKNGFRGCVKEISMNNAPIHLASKTGVRLESKKDVLNKCLNSAIDMGACTKSKCLHGGRCLPLSDGSHECECSEEFYGSFCEIADPCGTLPCKNKGYCNSGGDDIQCVCTKGFTGNRCEISLSCQNIQHCRNGGMCSFGSDGLPKCSCEAGWSGLHCENDVNECEYNTAVKRCGGKPNCFNYNGGYACNCSSAKGKNLDPGCQKVLLSIDPAEAKASSVPWQIFLAIGVGLVLVLGFILVVCLIKRRRRKSGTTDGQSRSSGFRSPPSVPPPPTDYHRTSGGSYMVDHRRADDQEQRRLIGYVQPQHPENQSMSAASDSDSMRKPSPSWPDYDPNKFNESAASSVRHFSPSQKTSSHSIADQQSYDWDVTDWKPEGSGVVPSSVARVACGRDRPREEGLARSPVSQRSIHSASTCRSGRSHRTDALAGHYSHGRIRGEKQLLHLLTSDKPTSGSDEIELQRVISSFVSQLETNKREESRNSSLRSASSRYQGGYRPQLSAVSSSYPSSSQSPYSGESPSSDISLNEYHEDIGGVEDISVPIHAYKNTHLPPPPTAYELQVLRGDEEDERILDETRLPAATYNKSYSSLLNSPFNIDMPTPAAARSHPYHPDQHLINHQSNISDLSLASGSDPRLEHPKSHPHKNDVRKRSEDTPPPPQRHDSERLAMSSLSEEETAFLHAQKQSRKKQRLGRPPTDANSRAKRLKKKSGASGFRSRAQPKHDEVYYYHPSKINSQDQIYLDTPGTTEV